MMKFLLLFILVSCASAPQLKHPFYWEVRYEKRTYSFLGTMHMGTSMVQLPRKIQEQLEDSQVLALENDKESLKKSTEYTKEYFRQFYGQYANPYPELKSEFDAETWERIRFTMTHEEVKKYLQEIKVSVPLESMHPALILLVVNHFVEKNRPEVFPPALLQGFTKQRFMEFTHDTESVLDTEILKTAESLNIPIVGLDDIGQIKKTLFVAYKSYGINAVKNIFSLNDNATQRLDDFHDLKQIYLSGDELAMAQYLDTALPDKETILYNRNKHWFDRLSQMEQKRIFVAVGVAHLVGPESLLSYFHDRGAKITRVIFK